MGERNAPVPRRWRGLWRRLAIEHGDGSGDIATRVLWLQGRRLFADIRIPADRPSVPRFEGYASLEPAVLDALARQEGFAGTLAHLGAHAHWRRDIDFHPAAGPPDEARLRRSRRVMVEHGLHRDYVEHWWLEDAAEPTEWARSGPHPRITLRIGDRFLDAEDRRPAPLPPGPLPALVAAAAGDEDRLRALLDCQISCGHVADGSWIVDLSTHPWREGATIEAPDDRFRGEMPADQANPSRP